MDAYDIHQEIFRLWQQVAYLPNASDVKKAWQEVNVYVDGRKVTSVTMKEGRIELGTK